MNRPFIPSTGVEERFAWLSHFPHGSGNERPLSDAIRGLAIKAGLESVQDEMGNLLVRKSAAPGCEGRPAVALQAHLDMVCTKEPGCEHNFLIDPLKLAVDEDGWLCAEGTSLGADDGYGVAYMLELMRAEDVQHPDLELLFTVQEEIGLIGAARFDVAQLRARRMISMDSGGETVTTVSTCGGRRITLSLPMRPSAVQGEAFRIEVSGLTGGHSAGEIHRGRGNAIKLLGHVLMGLEGCSAALLRAHGGEAANAIPRQAWAEILIPADRAGALGETFDVLREQLIKLYRPTDPSIELTLTPLGASEGPGYALDAARLLVALPDGVRAMDPQRAGVVALSDNVGTLETADGVLRTQCMIRSANPEWRELLSQQILAVGGAFGASCATDSDYPGMEYAPESAMRGLLAQVVREEFGAELTEEAAHGGMEIGYFSRSVPGLDIVTLGPLSEGCHSPSEKLNLESFNRMYRVLTKLLERVQ